MTSHGFGFADPPAGFPHLFALLRRRYASAALRSVLQLQLFEMNGVLAGGPAPGAAQTNRDDDKRESEPDDSDDDHLPVAVLGGADFDLLHHRRRIATDPRRPHGRPQLDGLFSGFERSCHGVDDYDGTVIIRLALNRFSDRLTLTVNPN